jgi:hypothetical protein
MIYLLTAVGFPPGGSGHQTCREIDNSIHEEKQYTKQYKNTEHTKQRAKDTEQ